MGGDAIDVGTCDPCLADYYCPDRGGTSETYGFGVGGGDEPANAYTCGAGFTCLEGVTDARPSPRLATATTGGVFCPAGHFCLQEVIGKSVCEVGYYQPNEGQSSCIHCPGGQLCDTTEMTAPVECPAGSYCP